MNAASGKPTCDPVDEFRNAMHAAGLVPPQEIIASGKIERFTTNGKLGDKAGWYVLHVDGVPAGIFGDWRTGLSNKWVANAGRKLTKLELEEQRAKFAAMRRERDAAERANHERAATNAESIWQSARPATAAHGYLTRKGVQPHGTMVGTDGRLLVPMYDSEGKLWNIERIAVEKPTDGSPDKKGLHLGKRKECHFIIGDLEDTPALCVVEGFATGASVYEATGLPTIVAFNVGNLGPVAKVWRKTHPELPLVICGDDDHLTPGNPGRTQAEEVALAVNGVAVFPVFGRDRPEKATDFNDLAQCDGLDTVKSQVMATVATLTERLNDDGWASKDSTEETDQAQKEDQKNSNPFPGEDERPCYVVLDDWVEYACRKHRPGVYFCGMTAEKRETPPTPYETWVCSPLRVDAITFDSQDNNFGRLLRFKNSLGSWREWAMPMELLRGQGDELRGQLLAMGVELDPYEAKRHLAAYLQREHPSRHMHCVLQVGWVKKSFVLPDTVIGPSAASVIFQAGERAHDEYTQSGTLHGWRGGERQLS